MNNLSPDEIAYIKRQVKAEKRKQRETRYLAAYLLIVGAAMVLFGLLLPGNQIIGVGSHSFALPAILAGISLLVFGLLIAFAAFIKRDSDVRND